MVIRIIVVNWCLSLIAGRIVAAPTLSIELTVVGLPRVSLNLIVEHLLLFRVEVGLHCLLVLRLVGLRLLTGKLRLLSTIEGPLIHQLGLLLTIIEGPLIRQLGLLLTIVKTVLMMD